MEDERVRGAEVKDILNFIFMNPNSDLTVHLKKAIHTVRTAYTCGTSLPVEKWLNKLDKEPHTFKRIELRYFFLVCILNIHKYRLLISKECDPKRFNDFIEIIRPAAEDYCTGRTVDGKSTNKIYKTYIHLIMDKVHEVLGCT